LTNADRLVTAATTRFHQLKQALIAGFKPPAKSVSKTDSGELELAQTLDQDRVKMTTGMATARPGRCASTDLAR
jgi:hypothetical protein